MKSLRAAIVAAAFTAAALGVAPADAHPGDTSRVGPAPGPMVPDETSPAMSLSGLFVAFATEAALARDDTNGVADVYVLERATGKVRRASVDSKGRQANAASHSPALDVYGRYAAFVSEATNLVTGDTNGAADVFLRDLKTGATSRVSVSSSEAQAGAASRRPFVSLFGRWIVFESAASNLARDDDNGLSDSFIRDVKTGKTTRIEPPPFEQLAPEFPLETWTQNAQISYDGRFVTFTRGATGYTPLHPAGLDTFVLDRTKGKVTQIPAPPYASRLPTGHLFTCRPMSDHAVISADGRYVAVEAWSACELNHALARNPVDPSKILRFDVARPKTISLLSLNTWGLPANGDCYDPRISANGQVVAFTCDATNVVAGDTNGASDVFVRDLGARTTSRVSLGPRGAQADEASMRPSISYEGRNVAFSSDATNLTSGDDDAAREIFWRDRRTDLSNRAPDLTPPFNGIRTVNALDEISIRLRARDPDGDPIRYSVIKGMPADATIDPETGRFTWTAKPGRYEIVFWVDDPKGYSDVALATIVVRDAQQTARCRLLSQCDA